MSNYERQLVRNSPEKTTSCTRKMFLMALNKFSKYNKFRAVLLAYIVKRKMMRHSKL